MIKIKQCYNSLYQHVAIIDDLRLKSKIYISKAGINSYPVWPMELMELVVENPFYELSTPALMVSFLLGIYNEEYFM